MGTRKRRNTLRRLVAAAGLIAATVTGGAAGAVSGHTQVTSTALPIAVDGWQLSVVAGRVQLQGSLATTTPDQSGPCVEVPLSTANLRLGTPRSTVCGLEAISGRRIGISSTYLRDDDNLVELSVTHVDPATGQMTAGPVILTYEQCSDCNPVTAAGGGWLWVYAPDSVEGPVILQISSTNGEVVNTVHLTTALFRPQVVADENGLWFGLSIDGGWSGPKPATLYRLAPGATTPTVVDPKRGGTLCWMVAGSTTVWAGVGKVDCATQTTLRYDGINPRPTFETPGRFGTLAVVGGRTGLWTFVPNRLYQATQTAMVRIDPATGRESIVFRSPSLVLGPSYYGDLSPGQAVLFHGSLYVLSLPYSTAGGFGRLFRITPG